MGMLRWLLGGMVGAAIGATIWVLVGYYTEYEVGWIAWGVGILAGLGVRFAADLGEQKESALQNVGSMDPDQTRQPVEQEHSALQGITAAGLAVVAILAAKFILFNLFVSKLDLGAMANSLPLGEESMIAREADKIASEMAESGQTVNWPPGMTYEEAEKQADYPPEIWQQAAEKWSGLSDSEKEQRRQEIRSAFEQFAAEAKPSFAELFSPWDLLWFGLAIVTAYRVGKGTHESKPSP